MKVARFLLLLLGLTTSAEAQAPLSAARIQPVRCAVADSLLGPKLAGTRAALNAAFVADRDQSLIFSAPPSALPTTPGIRYTTGLIRLAHRDVGPVPALELSLRVISDEERQAGTQWLQLMADDSVLGDSMPLALRRTEAKELRRVYQTATVPLTPAQTMAVARARHVTGALSDTRFALSDGELRELRAIVVVGLCGANHPW
jgi:hypothetical protein